VLNDFLFDLPLFKRHLDAGGDLLGYFFLIRSLKMVTFMMGEVFFGGAEAWRRLLMARFYDEEGRVRYSANTPFGFGYDGINRAPFRVSLSGVLPSIARFCFSEIFWAL
jgi:hypothetical protein